MSKLVDKDKLARLAAALDARAKAAVKAEEERALAAEGALQDAIDEINNAENGILANAKAYADQQVGAEKDLRVAEEATIRQELADEAAEIRGEMATEAARVDKKIADDIKVEADRAAAKEAELLQAIADEKAALQKEIDDDVKAEQEAREAADTALSNRLAIVEGFFGDNEDGNEISLEGVNKAIEEAKDAADAAQAAADQAQDEVDAVEGRMDAAEAAIVKLNGGEDVVGSVAKAVADAVAAEKGLREEKEAQVAQAMADETARVNKKIADDIAAESALRLAEEARIEGKVDAEATKAREEEGKLQAAIDVLNGDENKEGSVAKAVKAEADRAVAKEAELQGEIDAVEEDIARLDGAVDVEGSVKKQIKDAIDAVNQAADGLAGRVEDLEGEMDDVVADVAQVKLDMAAGDAKALEDAQKYADEKIAALVDSAPDAMNTLNELAKAIGDHQDVYDAYVEEISGELAKKVDKVEGSRLVSEAEIAAFAAKAEVADVTKCLQDAKDYVDGKDTAMDARMDDVEAFVEGHDHEAMIGRIAKLEAFEEAHDHSVIEQGIADNKAAIEKEVEDRDAAIEEALKVYSTTEQMKTILGNVVNSLALTMENDQVVLKLGGAEGIALTSVKLDLVTDDEIDAMIAELDAPAAE